jgi:KTSC domain
VKKFLVHGIEFSEGDNKMNMQPVISRAISAVGYDETTRRMKIRFTSGSGKAYDFCNVPKHIYESLLSASSKGTYYNNHIRDRYQC